MKVPRSKNRQSNNIVKEEEEYDTFNGNQEEEDEDLFSESFLESDSV